MENDWNIYPNNNYAAIGTRTNNRNANLNLNNNTNTNNNANTTGSHQSVFEGFDLSGEDQYLQAVYLERQQRQGIQRTPMTRRPHLSRGQSAPAIQGLQSNDMTYNRERNLDRLPNRQQNGHHQRTRSTDVNDRSFSGLQINTTLTNSYIYDEDGNLSPRSELIKYGRSQSAYSHFNKRKEYSNPPDSRLHDAARLFDWAKVKKLVEESSDLAKYVGNGQMMALHHACSRRPEDASVVKLLLNAYPDALFAQDNKGYTPFHYACRFKASVEVFQYLLYLYPKRAKKALQMKCRKFGRKPFFYSIRYDAPDGVMEMLLDVDTSGVLDEDSHGESPLSLVWTNYETTLIGKKMVNKYKQKVLNGETITLIPDTPFAKAWGKVEFLLQYALKRIQPTQNNEDWKMLHATCSIQCHHTLFCIASGLYPKQIEEIHTSTGRTALHCAASSPATGEGALNVIADLLTSFKEATRIKDNIDGSLPLHLIAENPKKQHWVELGAKDIYEAYPEAVGIKDSNGRLPLHRACMAVAQINQDVFFVARDTDQQYYRYSVVLQLLSLHKNAAKEKDCNDQMPLHILASNACGWDSDIQKVYEAYPKAVFKRDRHGRLPIHLAAGNPHASSALIEALYRYHPQGVRLTDGNGTMPMHLACSSGNDIDEKLECLYRHFKDVINMPDQSPNKWTPLHHACASTNVNAFILIDKLLTLHPDKAFMKKMVQMQDSFQRYPLHLACASGKSFHQGVGKLLEIYPEALIEADKFGLLPWHTATLSKAKVVDSTYGDQSVESDDESERDLLEEEKVLDKVNTTFELLMGNPYTVKNLNITN